MARRKSRTQLEAELNVLRSTRTSEGVVVVFNNLIRYGALVLVARYGYLAIEVLAGQATFADIAVNFLADVSVSVKIAWCAGIGGGAYGLYQRKLRKDTVERLQGRIQSLERTLDPNRSTSNLTIRGNTRPEDAV